MIKREKNKKDGGEERGRRRRKLVRIRLGVGKR